MTENKDGRQEPTTDGDPRSQNNLTILDGDEVWAEEMGAGGYNLQANSTVRVVIDIEGQDKPIEKVVTTRYQLVIRGLGITQGDPDLNEPQDMAIFALSTEDAIKEKMYAIKDEGTYIELNTHFEAEKEQIRQGEKRTIFVSAEDKARRKEVNKAIRREHRDAQTLEAEENRKFIREYGEELGIVGQPVRGIRIVAGVTLRENPSDSSRYNIYESPRSNKPTQILVPRPQAA